MRVLIAPQGFKETLGGQRAAEAIAEGLRRVVSNAEIDLLPVADGGHGTLDILLAATNGTALTNSVTGPIGQPVEARWGVLGGGLTGVVEMAEASGLVLVPEPERDPMRSTTYGTGQLLRIALESGLRNIIVGVGGSATADAGAGVLQALGARLLDSQQNEVPFGAAGLLALAHISTAEIHPSLAEAHISVAVDVTNPLSGPQGAAMIYGRQKGAAPHQLPILDAALINFAEVVARDVGINIRGLPGFGAGGGLGAGLVTIGARLVPGASLVCDTIDIDSHLKGAELVVTGEGRLDGQTAFNKAPMEVAKRAIAHGVPCVAIGGSIGPGADALLSLGVRLLEATGEDGAPLPGEAEAYSRLADGASRLVRRVIELGLVSGST